MGRPPMSVVLYNNDTACVCQLENTENHAFSEPDYLWRPTLVDFLLFRGDTFIIACFSPKRKNIL